MNSVDREVGDWADRGSEVFRLDLVWFQWRSGRGTKGQFTLHDQNSFLGDHTPLFLVRHDLTLVARHSALTPSSDLTCLVDRLIEHGFMSAPTQYRLYGRRFLQVWWPNQQCQSTEGGWLVIQACLNVTMLTSPCYNCLLYTSDAADE